VPAFGSLPKWAWFGGTFAAYYLVASLIGVPKLGTAAVFSSVIAGQMLTALILDSTGAFGVPHLPLSPARIAGAAMLVMGVVIMQRG
jgi:transporter family-2 protein